MTNLTSTTDEVRQEFIQQARAYLRDEYLPKIEACLDQLTDEQVWWRPNSESNSIGNLLLHLSGNVRQWIACGLGGQVDHRVRQEEFDRREIIQRGELLELLRQTLRDVDQVLAEFKTQELLEFYKIQGNNVRALHAIFHVVEHFSMHTGQIILVTKMLTGRDLNFYDFPDGVPVHTWQEQKQE
jgi:uncharacterized damage-inducible protein DinB